MIEIDKTDALYKYLSALGVEGDKLNELYLELAKNGRYKKKDIQTYFSSTFQPSVTEDLSEEELEPILDYYIDIKKIKKPAKAQIQTELKTFCETQNKALFSKIQTYFLMDVLHLCLNYKTLHKDVDLQDLVQLANIGLNTAIKKYSPNNKLDINDYIIFYIREKIKELEEKN